MSDASDQFLDTLIDAMAGVLQLTIEDAWKPAIKGNLRVTLRLANLVAEFELPEEMESRGGRVIPRRALARRPHAHALSYPHQHLRARFSPWPPRCPTGTGGRQGRATNAKLGAPFGRLAGGGSTRQHHQ